MRSILFLFIHFACVINASGSDKDSLKAIADYQNDGLQIIFALINDKGFFDEWRKPEMPHIKSIDTYKRGEEAIPIIIFGTDGKDKNGNANLTYDIKIIKPDSTVYAEFKQLEIWKDVQQPVLHILKQPVVIHIEQNDPFGIYTIYATVYENNKNQKVNFVLRFQVIK